MKTMFMITIDTETRTAGDPRADILGILPGLRENYGIEKIMNILEAHHVRGTFFLNIYESAKYGEGIIASAAKLIHSRGHDLELHTHPRPMYPYYGMSQAPLEDQTAILESGISFLEKWTGKRAVAHRAGAFSANTNTLLACEKAGLLADCSLSPGSKVVVPLVDALGASNVARRTGKIWEIPVTYYQQVRFGSLGLRRILDIEGSSLAEIKKVVRWALKNKMPTVCILMHSFSLSRRGQPNRRIIRRLSALLAWLRTREDVEVSTLEEVCRYLVIEPPQIGITSPPVTGVLLTWHRTLLSWNDGWKNRIVAVTGVASFITLIVVLGYVGHVLLRH